MEYDLMEDLTVVEDSPVVEDPLEPSLSQNKFWGLFTVKIMKFISINNYLKRRG